MKKICVFFLALAVFLLPEMVYAANATPQAVNMPHVYIVFGVLFVAAVLFFTEWIPLAVTSILVPCALSTLGVITVKEAWVSFGDTSILTIVGLFMLGEATFATGFAQRVATSIINKAGASETRLLVFSILLIAFMSAFLNNAGVTAITLPMLISIARKAHLSPSRILLPTAYAASFGGCISLVGQAPSMVANGILAKMAPEYGQFAFFEFAWFGLPLTLLAALLFGLFPRFLVPPAREDVAELKEIETPEGGIHMWIAGGIYFLVIICMATGLVPLTSAAMLGAMLCVITRCMTPQAGPGGHRLDYRLALRRHVVHELRHEQVRRCPADSRFRGQLFQRSLYSFRRSHARYRHTDQHHVQYGHHSHHGASGHSHRSGHEPQPPALRHGHRHECRGLLHDAHRHALQYAGAAARQLYLRGLRPVRLFLAGSLLCPCCADYPFRLAFHALTAFMGVFVQMRALICSYFGQRIYAKMVLASNITTYQTIIEQIKDGTIFALFKAVQLPQSFYRGKTYECGLQG